MPGAWGAQRLGKGVGAVSCALCLAWSQEPPLGEKGMEYTTPQRPLRNHQKHTGDKDKSQDLHLENARPLAWS